MAENVTPVLTGIFDTHAHYDDPVFAKDLSGVLRNQQAQGVSHIIASGSSVPTSENAVRIAQQYDFVYASAGVYPLESYDLPADWLARIEALCAQPKVVAVGEIGLDYFEASADRQAQQRAFRSQLALAARLTLPVVIHDRDADADMLRIVRETRPKGEIHRFYSSPEYGRAFLAEGLSLAIGPALTYPDADHLRQTVREMPMERMLLETDAPFLLPAHLAQTGAPALSDMIVFVAQAVAEIRGDVSPQQVLDITRENAKRLFAIL